MPHIACTILHGMQQKNDAVFGKCNNPSYHGHNYEMEVKVTGVPDA